MRRILAVLLVLGFAAPLAGSQAQVVKSFSLTIDATVGGVGLPAAAISPSGQPQIARCSGRLETAQVRYQWDGTAPTSAVGELLEVGDRIGLDDFLTASRVRFIRTGATSGVLQGTCWK